MTELSTISILKVLLLQASVGLDAHAFPPISDLFPFSLLDVEMGPTPPIQVSLSLTCFHPNLIQHCEPKHHVGAHGPILIVQIWGLPGKSRLPTPTYLACLCGCVLGFDNYLGEDGALSSHLQEMDLPVLRNRSTEALRP